MINSTKTQTIEFPLPQCDMKASIFLKNYHEKLKRQRKKQQKLNSFKHIHLKQNNRTLNSNSYIQNSVHNIIPVNKATISTSNSIIVNKSIPMTTRNSSIRSTSSIGSQILVFKKSPFLDTSNQTLARKNYRNDSTLQVLLKEIYQIKQEQIQEIQKLKKKRFNSMDSQLTKKTKRDYSLQDQLSKYEKGFSLPASRRRFLINGIITQSPLQRQLNGSLTSRLESKLLMTVTDRLTTNRQRQKQRKNKFKLQKLDNFKSIEPWEIHNSKYQYNHRSQYENGYLMEQMESLCD